MGERYPRLHLKNQRNGKRFDEDPLIGLETLFQCRRPPKEKACDVNPPSVTFIFFVFRMCIQVSVVICLCDVSLVLFQLVQFTRIPRT